MQVSLFWRRLFLLLVVVAIPLFFIGGPSAYSLEIYRRFWDLGHPVFFAIVSFLLIGYGVIKTTRQFVIAMCLVFFASLAIEKLQTYVGREASWLDVLLNISGFLVGSIFLPISRQQKFVLLVAVVVGLLPGLLKLFKSLMVCWSLWQQFPILLGGESRWAEYAWGSDIKLEKISGQAGYSLQFNGKAYRSADMMGFMQSWKGYKKIILKVENPSNESFVVTLRISDKQHEIAGREYSDRFNHRLLVQPGKQMLEINLEEIEAAPANRKMNLDEIYLLKLFLPEDGKQRTLHLYTIYLDK